MRLTLQTTLLIVALFGLCHLPSSNQAGPPIVLGVQPFDLDLERQIDRFVNSSNKNFSEWKWTSWIEGPPCPKTKLDIVPLDTKNANITNAMDQFHLFVKKFMSAFSQRGLPIGLSIGAVYNGNILFTENYGTINATTNEPPTADTIYDMGSVTKVFTSMMMMKMIDDGIVDLDSTVNQFYNEDRPPAFKMKNPYLKSKSRRSASSNSDVSFHMLSTHTSGLPREPPCGVYGNCNETVIFDLLNQINLMSPPYQVAHYSNLGISLLGHSLARAANTSYEQYLVTNILKPLGMLSSGFEFSEKIKNRMAVGYTVANGKMVVAPTNTMSMGWSTPCGGMYSTVNDMCHFLSYLLDLPENSGVKMSQSRMNEFFLPGVNFEDGVSSFGLGTWETFYANNYWTLTKAGLVPGYASNIAFVPELRLGVVALINLGSGAVDAVTTNFMNAFVPALHQFLLENQPSPPLPPTHKSLEGTYSYQGVVYLQLERSSRSGYFRAYIAGMTYKYYAKWAPEQDNKENDITAMQLFIDDDAMSCVMKAYLPAGIMYFKIEGNHKVTVTIPDINLWQVPKSPEI